VLAGRDETSGVLMWTRDWRRSDNPEVLQCDAEMFAPTVRELRWKHGRTHDEHASHGVKELFGCHAGQTAVILGCGPSLPRALPYVKELREKHGHIVIASNMALTIGFDQCTDYYVLLCWLSQPWWWKRANRDGIKCVCSFQTPPEVARDWKERYYYADTFVDVTMDVPEARQEYGTLDGGGTVTYSALHLAWKMGCSRIVFAGMDYAWTNYEDHPGDPMQYEKGIARNPKVVRDIHGNATVSDAMLLGFCDLMKMQTALVQDAGIPCINITDGGIFDIGGNMPPEEYMRAVRDGDEFVQARPFEKFDKPKEEVKDAARSSDNLEPVHCDGVVRG
jgi:hypothetical protein